MAVNQYQTDRGKFTVINDSALKTAIEALDFDMPLSRDGVETAEAEAFREVFDDLNLSLNLISPSGIEIDSEKLQWYNAFFPNTTFEPVEATETEQSELLKISGEGDSYIQLRYRTSQQGTPHLTAYSEPYIMGQSLGTPDALLGYTDGTYVPATDKCNIFKSQIIVMADDYTDGISVSFRGEYRTGQYVVVFGIGSIDYPEDIADWLNGCTPVPPDPYPGGQGNNNGGNGDKTDPETEIPENDPPTLNAIQTGFISLFRPNVTQLNNLASFMWSQSWYDVDNWQKSFLANPMDAIIGLSIMPGQVPAGNSIEVKTGNVSTGVSMPLVSQQYITVDCGSLDIEPYWDSYLDYSPYTQYRLYLPYIGVHQLSVDDIQGKTVSIKYKIDVLSGACVAQIFVSGKMYYSFPGQISLSVPLTSVNYGNAQQAMTQLAVGQAQALLTKGKSVAFTGTSDIVNSAVSIGKEDIAYSGTIASMPGMLDIQYPYFIVNRPNKVGIQDQNMYTGYPSFQTVKLSSMQKTGYVEIESIHLENIPATDAELNEIEGLLKSGVML